MIKKLILIFGIIGMLVLVGCGTPDYPSLPASATISGTNLIITKTYPIYSYNATNTTDCTITNIRDDD